MQRAAKVIVFVAMAMALVGCTARQAVDSNPNAWTRHDALLAQLGKEAMSRCSGPPADYEECTESAFALIDSWCEMYRGEDSKACGVLDAMLVR